VLVALNPLERECFFGSEFPALPEAEIHMADVSDEGVWASLLDAIRPEVLVVGWSAPALPEGYLEQTRCPLRYICFVTGSVRRLVPRRFVERGGWASNWGDVVAPMVAEHALLLLLAALRRLPEWPAFFTPPAGEPPAPLLQLRTRSLRGRTVSLHGFGFIARELVRLLQPFDVRLRAYSAGVPADYMREWGVEPVDDLNTLFGGAEIVVECEALTPASIGTVGAEQINWLAEHAVFVNVGRGAVVDEVALARRAATGKLHLALDVFAAEPLATDSPLRAIPGALLSPHIAGPTHDRLLDLGRRAILNLQRYLAGQPPLGLITPEIYDRST
jgi:phosphoglycerate dehydrogenase-like enzyme